VRRVTLDTNVLVSALMYRRGKPFQLLRMALEGEVSVMVSEAIIEETLEVLGRKFGVPQEELPEYRAVITDASRIIKPTVSLDVVKDDPDDNRILECAVTSWSEFVVTGDKDLLRLKRYDSIRILTVADFFNVLQAQERER
jgi:putative PIN family toxin of toxin-antitoxin system